MTTGLFAGVPKPVMHTTKFDIVFTFISHAGYRRSCFSSVVIGAICMMIIQSLFNDTNYRKVIIKFLKRMESLNGSLPIMQILLALVSLLPIGWELKYIFPLSYTKHPLGKFSHDPVNLKLDLPLKDIAYINASEHSFALDKSYNPLSEQDRPLSVYSRDASNVISRWKKQHRLK